MLTEDSNSESEKDEGNVDMETFVKDTLASTCAKDIWYIDLFVKMDQRKFLKWKKTSETAQNKL